jgi:hypothetical protein
MARVSTIVALIAICATGVFSAIPATGNLCKKDCVQCIRTDFSLAYCQACYQKGLKDGACTEKPIDNCEIQEITDKGVAICTVCKDGHQIKPSDDSTKPNSCVLPDKAIDKCKTQINLGNNVQACVQCNEGLFINNKGLSTSTCTDLPSGSEKKAQCFDYQTNISDAKNPFCNTF